jgi:hypothetical protein
MFTLKSIALAALVVMTSVQSYAGPLRTTSIPSSLADDKKRLMPEVMNEFYGAFVPHMKFKIEEIGGVSYENKEDACWISKHTEGEYESTYCMKPISSDVRSSAGRKTLFIVAFGQQIIEDGDGFKILEVGHPTSGGLGLIVLTPNGANLGVVATNDFYDWLLNYNRGIRPDTVTLHLLGPDGAYGWIAKSDEDHSGYELRWATLYGVIGNSVKPLTTITSYYSDRGRGGEWPKGGPTTLSVKYAFDRHSSASSFYPIMLQVSGIKNGRPFHGDYRLVFDDKPLKYITPENMPDEINPPHPITEIKP